MSLFHRFIAPLLAALLLVIWKPGARAEDLFQRLSALRLLQMQSQKWNAEEKHSLTLSGSLEGHYTSNAALSRGGSSDWYSAPLASISTYHRLSDTWSISAGTDAGGFRYLKQPDLGTSYLDAWGSLSRDFRVGGLESNAYLTATQQWNQLKNYSASGASTEVQIGMNTDWEFLPGHTVSWNPALSATPYSSPWDAGYASIGAMISYDWVPNSHVDVSCYYNGYASSYFNRQTDFTQFVGVGITWTPCEVLTFSISATQTWNMSTNTESQYSAFDVGGMLGLQWRL